MAFNLGFDGYLSRRVLPADYVPGAMGSEGDTTVNETAGCVLELTGIAPCPPTHTGHRETSLLLCKAET